MDKNTESTSQRIWRGNKGYKENQKYKEELYKKELYKESEKDIIIDNYDEIINNYDEKGELISLEPNVKIWTNL